MLKKSLISTLLFMLCYAAVADSVEMGKKIYNDTLVSGATKDKIWFLLYGRIHVERPADEVTKITIDSFPEFNKAEEFVSQGQYAQAMANYIEAYKAISNIRDAWRRLSLENLNDGHIELSETLEANADSDWIKDLIKFRYGRAKELLSGKITINSQEEKGPSNSAESDDKKFCPECRGRGKVKCARCNGSGQKKCTHTVDGEIHPHYYEICPTCKGRGFKIEYYTVKVWVPRVSFYDTGHYEDKVKARKVVCSNPQCTPYPKDPKIFVVWLCPYCANAEPVGYINCPYCDKGRRICAKCNGTGTLTNNEAAEEKADNVSPNALLNSLEKEIGEKLPQSPYKEQVGANIKGCETFDQTIGPFIIAAQKQIGESVTWSATVKRVLTVKTDSFLIATFVRDNDNTDIWEIKATIHPRYVRTGEKFAPNSTVEIKGKITGIDFKYETITLNADELKIVK